MFMRVVSPFVFGKTAGRRVTSGRAALLPRGPTVRRWIILFWASVEALQAGELFNLVVSACVVEPFWVWI